MKNIYLIIFLAVVSSSKSQIITFQDAVFKNALVTTQCAEINGNSVVHSDVDLNNDGEIDLSEALSVTSLTLCYLNINSLSGIEHFTNLLSLDCYNNNLTNLDLSSLSYLTNVNCNSNQLTSLNISNLNNLAYLKCGSNQLTNINFENHPSLVYVICSNNLFTELNICGTAIYFFWCNDNPNLQHLTLKNGVISNLNPNKVSLTPPPLPAFNLYNLPALNSLCYDDGELHEITFHASGFNQNGVTLSTDCPTNCLLGNPVFENSTVKIYPNPTTDKIYFDSGTNNEIYNLSIYTTLGQLLISKTYTPNNQVSCDLSLLNSGTYIVRIETNQGNQITKFIKL